MTADEVSFAGGVSDTSLSSPYAWYYINSKGTSITGVGTEQNSWWLLSSSFWSANITHVRIFVVTGSINISTGKLYSMGDPLSNSKYYKDVVRPVISITKCAKVKSGNGTPESPYEIDENSCSK